MAKSVFGSRASETVRTWTSQSRELQVSEDIMPIAELKAHLSETVRGLAERPRPLVVTLNGKPAAVVMSPGEYDRLTARARFVGAIEEGLADTKAGRTISDEDLGREMETWFRTETPTKRVRRGKRR